MIFHPSIMHRKLSFGVYDVQFSSSVETITATGEGMVSHSIVWCGTVWFVMVWTINVETTTVTGAGAVSRSRQQFSSKHPDMSGPFQCHIFTRPSSLVGLQAQYPQSCVKCIFTHNHLIADAVLYFLLLCVVIQCVNFLFYISHNTPLHHK